jgi:hypothetical protein
MVSVIARFKRRREYANGNTDKDEENGDAVIVNADSEPTAKKKKKTPAKNKPLLLRNTMLNYFDKSPERGSQHQPLPQGPSRGFNIEIDQYQDKVIN